MSRSIARVAAALLFALTVPSGANAAGVHSDATVTCNIPQPCALYENANGIGLSATSAKSEGLYGSTTFAATAVRNRTFGVEGVDASTNKNYYNGGLYGSSPYGYGLYATSPNGTAVYATSTSGVGVRAATMSDYAINAASASGTAINANSTSGTAVNAESNSNIAILATSTASNAINATSSNETAVVGTTLAPNENGGVGVEGVDRSTFGWLNGGRNDGVFGQTGNGAYGVEGLAGPGAEAAVSGLSLGNAGFGVTAEGFVGLYGSSDDYPLTLANAGGAEVLYVTGAGDMYTQGSYNTDVHTRNGDAIAFTSRSTTSSLEDSGTAELVGGTATVRFDPTFAAAIDAHAVYQVSLTPCGDTRGLYVARKTPAGFVVRETQGGRGTLSFDYRILAASQGHAADRMALVSATSVHGPRALLRKHSFALTKALSLMKKYGAK